jgi:hypothetical protein
MGIDAALFRKPIRTFVIGAIHRCNVAIRGQNPREKDWGPRLGERLRDAWEAMQPGQNLGDYVPR